jgi:adenosylcobinamide-GDP ribazoletransferase
MESPSPLLEKQTPTPLAAPGRWGRNAVTAFFTALQFLTIAPAVLRRPFTPVEMGRAVGFFPVVGLLLGGVLLGLDEATRIYWMPGLGAALVLAAWVIASGALHLDGLLDACDGLLGGRTPEDRLRIMKDARVGAFAVVGGALFVLLKYLALASVDDRMAALLLAPALGRWAMVLAIVLFPYARAEGLGRSMKDHAGWRDVVLGTLTAVAASWLAGGERGLLAMAVAFVAVWLAGRFTLKRLPGLTGDIYGAICEIVELLVLLIFAARAPA